MPARHLKQYLDENNVQYVTIDHSTAYTAQETAAAAHIPGQELAKTLIVKIDGELAMAVLPASYVADLDALRETIGAGTVELAEEHEFAHIFPDCEMGAMPPFGNLYGLDVYVAEKLAEDDEIAFNACSHSELIKMAYEDFERLAQPKVLVFAARRM